MPYWYQNYKKRQAPKAVPGATRKEYGITWWGKQWLKALEGIDDANRLPRGKTYANKGLAHDLELQGNNILAKVSGSDPRPYRVKISIPEFDAAVCERLVHIITENPLFLSRLLNRELPPELNEACMKAGIHIFPRRWSDFKGSCSCPDWAVPCKHMAAVFFLIANEIDKNPFTVFDLHGFDLATALQNNGYSERAVESTRILRLAELQQAIPPAQPAFSFDEDTLAALDFSTIPECRDNLFQLLTEKPVFFPEGNFKKALETVYKRVGASVYAVAAAKEAPDPEWSLCEKALLILDAQDSGFIGCSLFDTQERSMLDFATVKELSSFLESLPEAQVAQSAPELRVLHLIYRMAKVLAHKGAFVPQILKGDTGACFVRFVPARLNEEVRVMCETVSSLTAPGMLVYVGEETDREPLDRDYLSAMLAVFLGYFVREFAGNAILESEVSRLFFSGHSSVFEGFQNREYPNGIHLWLGRFFISEKNFVPVFEVRNENEHFEVLISMEDRKAAFHAPVPLEKVFSDEKYAHLKLDILRDLSVVAEYFPTLRELIASKGKEKLHFDGQTFVDVLFKALPVIRLFGIRVLLPKALQQLLRPAVSASLSAKNKGKISGTGLLSFAAMIDFQWQIALGDETMSAADFLKLVKNMRGIVRLANGYVFVDEKEVAALIEKIAQMPVPPAQKLLQMAFAGDYQGTPIRLSESMQNLMSELLRPDATPLPAGLVATLRPYQTRGFEWLYKNTRLGLGSLIADDMGLGKTIQVIALLLRLKEDGALGDKQKALVVVPTTLLTNWNKEIARFAPELRTHLYHGPSRSLTPLAGADILLTTYGVVRSEIETFQKKDWQLAIIDEAQNIKNLETAQAKAVKKLKAPVRIAMTGTPVENRLSEYYAIFEFANHGYLGSLKSFMDEFAKPIELERNRAALDRFQRVITPFLLRRVKTDKSIISDLPDKIESNQFCSLTPEQAALYQNVVNESLKAISAMQNDDFKRQGLVLKMLTALKQVCNHPAHFLKKPKADPMLSGKTQRLLELLTQVLETGEKALIFTQYSEMGHLLVPILREQLGIEAAFLHGGVSRKSRDKMVEDFQHSRSARVLILSLKAGGAGLNLTAASNVIHYDLWWNPAVEAQATDRAFRIGQQRNVQVHRFITQNTFEEKIDALIQSKKELANLTVTAGEKWVGDLSDKELRELVLLR